MIIHRFIDELTESNTDMLLLKRLNGECVLPSCGFTGVASALLRAISGDSFPASVTRPGGTWRK